ncbi:hypothetical protein LTR96_011002 [Exophiala xenobiotica]|nr:hypothetical protein LTR41_011121 [Exophiala xenobiotica]KAK5215908.1 hypothetical protein LTR72_011080 [Exophiala xenobiotica]KAK5263622.1 hypothetical protein LTR96_011002 [Exophiala xenobiotica]KAK5285402.1 hypothetical protein LTR14_010986 [Exophiala xenobiotica]KAK5358977.1 hypothetical protein LTS03_011104 [Exophiala xenobiotica]
MAGLAFYDYGGDFLAMPYVDHPHERAHQHRTFPQYLARQNSPPEQNPNRPDVDIRDTVTEYVVEIEIPGVKRTSEVTVKWISTTSLVVIGSVERTAWSEPQKEVKVRQPPPPQTETEWRDSSGDLKASEKHLYEPDLIVGERRIGPFRRYINFPVEVDAERVTAKLEAGLLILRAPKAKHHFPKHDLNVEIVT